MAESESWFSDCHNVTNTTSVHDEESESKTFLFIFGSLAVGAIIRQVLKRYHFPYTVVVFLVGGVFGFFSHGSHFLRTFTGLTRVNPEVMMQVFLPALIFESAYSMNAHLFLRTITQSLTLAGPGLMLCTGLTAVYAKTVLAPYGWNWTTAFIFGSVLSATDPVAVVALLKECGIAPTLTTLIEGESLLNDGSAIVIFEVLLRFLKSDYDILPIDDALIEFAKVTLGTPLFGLIMGKLAVLWLVSVYKDPAIEFGITLCAAYVTYYAAESLMDISGVLAVVVVGVVISYHKGSFTPESERAVHSFWETLSYFANTMIFIIVGVIITERASRHVSFLDTLLAVCTYFTITVFRMIMTLIFSPCLTRLGYGLPWRHAIVLTWAGVRGAVGLALSLMLAEDPYIDVEAISNKILLQLSVIVLLTLVVNGITMRYVLRVLGMHKVSRSHRLASAHAIAHLRDTVFKSEEAKKRDKYLSKANWLWVESHTFIKDPFNPSDETDPTLMYIPSKSVRCAVCNTEQPVAPTEAELSKMSEEARLRVLKTLKASYWKYFKQGVISRQTVRALTEAADEAADEPGNWNNALACLMQPFYYDTILEGKKILLHMMERLHLDPVKHGRTYLQGLYDEARGCRRFCLGVYMEVWFESLMCVIVLLNIIPVVLQAVPHHCTSPKRATELSFNFIFLLAYVIEAVIKMVAVGRAKYFRSLWNRYDMFVIIAGIVDYVMDISLLFFPWTNHSYIAYARIIRFVRLIEMYKVFRRALIRLLSFLKDLASSATYEAVDLAHGYIYAQEEIMEKLDFIVDYKPCGLVIRHASEEGVLEIMKALAHIHKEHPGIVMAQKSHTAARRVFNDVAAALWELREDGVIDEVEYERLNLVIENGRERIRSALNFLPPCKSYIDLLKRTDWVSDRRLIDIIQETYIVKEYHAHQIIHDIGDTPKGVLVIVSGVVKIQGKIDEPSEALPNTDSLVYFVRQDRFFDYVISGQTLGMLGYLVKTPYATSAICETDVKIIHISTATLQKAAHEMTEAPSLDYLLWKNIAFKIAEHIIADQPVYQGTGIDRIRLKLENAILPDLSRADNFKITPNMHDVVLIQGRARDSANGTLYIGPSYVPTTVSQLLFVDKPGIRPRIVMVLIVDESYLLSKELDWSGTDSVPPEKRLCLLHTVRHRRDTFEQHYEEIARKSSHKKGTRKHSALLPAHTHKA